MQNKNHLTLDINTLNKSRYLIMLDLDGTLLNSKEKIDSLTVKTIRKIVSLGHVVVIATGRPRRASIGYYNQLGLNSFLVNYNGSFISNPSNSKYQPLNLSFSYELAKNIFKNKKIRSSINNIIIENNEGVFVSNKIFSTRDKYTLFDHFHINSEKEVKFIKPDWSNIKSDIHSILIQVNNSQNIDDITYEIKSLSNTLMIRSWSLPSNETIIEINSIFSSKGMALKYISAYYGIPLEKCITFGDGDNDAEMLRSALFSFAMKNGSTTCKLSAKYLTEFTNNESGVGKTLKKIFHI